VLILDCNAGFRMLSMTGVVFGCLVFSAGLWRCLLFGLSVVVSHLLFGLCQCWFPICRVFRLRGVRFCGLALFGGVALCCRLFVLLLSVVCLIVVICVSLLKVVGLV